MSKIIKLMCFGTGGLSDVVKRAIDPEKAAIVGYINSDKALEGSVSNGLKVIHPESLCNVSYDLIIIAAGACDSMVAQLKSVGVGPEKMAVYNALESKTVESLVMDLNARINTFRSRSALEECMFYRTDVIGLATMPILGRSRSIDLSDRLTDFVRYSSLELVGREIERNKIPGCVAELGVYRGDFAVKINETFGDRKLYLFDTFVGFDHEQAENDQRNGLTANVGTQFVDTSPEQVLSRMKYPEKCVVRAGLFPATATGLENEVYCFVSIDADLFEPILDGLKYFYPRLAPGGFIFVHDYNNSIFMGANLAVREFADTNKLAFFPLSDSCGTAVFAK